MPPFENVGGSYGKHEGLVIVVSDSEIFFAGVKIAKSRCGSAEMVGEIVGETIVSS